MLQHLEQAEFPLKRENCSVMLSFVEYLEYSFRIYSLKSSNITHLTDMDVLFLKLVKD